MFLGDFVISKIWEAPYEVLLLLSNYMAIHRCYFVFNGVLDCLCLFFFLPPDLSERDMLVLGSMKSEWLEVALRLGSVCVRKEARGKREGLLLLESCLNINFF